MKRKSIIRQDGAKISYQTIGEGFPTTLVQGLGMPGDAWKDTAVRLADRGFKCIVVDNRGTGYSTHTKGIMTMKMLADDVAAVMEEELGRNTRSHVVGISLGGMISQHVALRHPRKVSGLMLVSTTCGLPYNLINGAFFRPTALALLAKICFSGSRPTLEQMQRLLAHPESTPRLTEIFLNWEAMIEEQPTPNKTYASQLLAATLHNTGPFLHMIPHRTYVVTGDEDFLMPPQNALLLSQLIPDARHEIIPKAGHILPQEHPDAIPNLFEELHQDTQKSV